MAGGLGYLESRWKPKSRNTRYRFIFVRKHLQRQNEVPIQLDLFESVEYGCELKVIVTNKRISPRKVVRFHEGRGSQEGIFAELKTHCRMGSITHHPPTDRIPFDTILHAVSRGPAAFSSSAFCRSGENLPKTDFAIWQKYR